MRTTATILIAILAPACWKPLPAPACATTTGGKGCLTGRFSSDGSTLSAEEIFDLQFMTGETLRFRYDWNAMRR